MDEESVWNVLMRSCRIPLHGGWDLNEGWGNDWPPWWPDAVNVLATAWQELA